MKIKLIILIAILQIQGFWTQSGSKIKFIANRLSNEGAIESFTNTKNEAEMKNFCSIGGNLTFLVHAWQEDTTIFWREPMTRAFLEERGGCVIWMDYSYYSISPFSDVTHSRLIHYPTLRGRFDYIASVLMHKMLDFKGWGYAVENSFIFGFSFGAHLATEAAFRYKLVKSTPIHRVDICDPAGPLFDGLTSSSVVHAASSVTNLQVIHTSDVFGATFRYGGKSVNMGICGTKQLSTTDDKEAHYLSVKYYLEAFTNNFPFVDRATINSAYGLTGSNQCSSAPTSLPDGPVLPQNRMGYHCDMSVPDGTYFAYAGASAPYNV